MRLLADEFVDAGLVRLLRVDGHDVQYAAEELRGIKDAAILKRAVVEKRLILTEDRGYGDLVFRLGKPAVGIIVLSIDPRNGEQQWPRLKVALDRHGQNLFGQYTVIGDSLVRFRSLPTKRGDR